jgi:tRNA A-37 threonylcarbamoyl transferase component Bud32
MSNLKIIVHHDYKHLTPAIERIPDTFATEGKTLYSGRNLVKQFLLGQEEVVVKRYKRPNFIQKIAYTFLKKGKAERAYLFAGKLRERGIETPHEIAYIEEKHHGMLRDSYFVSTVTHNAELFDLLLKSDTYDANVIPSLASFLVLVHEKGVMHGDLNLSNILYRKDETGRYVFCLIDTNRSKFIDAPSKEICLENLKRLTHRRDILRKILIAYAECRGWNAEECVRIVEKKLEAFERRRALKHCFKKKKK